MWRAAGTDKGGVDFDGLCMALASSGKLCCGVAEGRYGRTSIGVARYLRAGRDGRREEIAAQGRRWPPLAAGARGGRAIIIAMAARRGLVDG